MKKNHDIKKKQLNLENVIVSIRSWFLCIAGISFVVNILALTGPIFMLQVYDRVLVSGSVPTLIAISSLALILYLFFGFLETVRARILFRMGQHVDTRLSAKVYTLSNRQSLELDVKGKKVAPVQDLDSVTGFLSGHGPAAIFDAPWLPFYLCIVFLFHSTLGYLALAGATIISLLVVLNEILLRKPASVAALRRSHRNSLIDEGRRNAETIRAMGMSQALAQRWEQANFDSLLGQRSAADWSGFFATSIKTIRLVLQSAILAVGAWLAIRQEISPGIMIAASIVTSRALAPVEQAVANWRGFVAARQSFIRLSKLMGTGQHDAPSTNLEAPRIRLDLKHVFCGPSATNDPVILGASFGLKAGDGLAILGPSGSGKSTLAKAITGAIDIVKGDIRLDGATLAQWSDAQKGRFIGYLPQELDLFDGSVAQNISRFDQNASSEEVVEAATMANVHDLILNLPNGYDTAIGSAGIQLSGGQKQRIALARAIFRKPFLLVLDEPNSNLDAEGEAALAKALLEMRKQGSIVVLVAHRPQVLASVNKILCLKDGRIAAIGPKDEVMGNSLVSFRSKRAA